MMIVGNKALLSCYEFLFCLLTHILSLVQQKNKDKKYYCMDT